MVKPQHDLNWNDLKFFLMTARAGKLTVAGSRLNVDHATVSRRISALEKSCGEMLFDRSPRGYALTEAGRRLVPFAEAVESSTMHAMDAFGENTQDVSGAIRIGAPDGIASTIVAESAQRLCETHRNLEIQIIAAPRNFSLSKREADFAISVSKPAAGRLRTYRIADYDLHLYASSTFLRAHPPIKTIEDLRKVRGIGYISDLIFDKSLDYIPLVGPNLTPHLTSTNLLIQREWALNGAGVCILPDFLVANHSALQQVLSERIHFKRSFWMILHEDLASIARIKLVADQITEDMRTQLKPST